MTNKMNQSRKLGQRKNSVAKVVRSILSNQAERRVLNYSIGSTTFLTAGAVDNITQTLIQGSGTSQRDGSRIMLKSLEFREVDNLTTATVGATVRVILFLDKLNQGTTPAVADLLDNASVQSPYSILQQVNNRFQVLYDKTQGMVLSATSQDLAYKWKWTGNVPITYNGTTNAASSNGRNALYALHITDLGVASPTYRYSISARFTDS